MAELPTAGLDAENPWPGLAAFAEADRAYFRGREVEADELVRLVRRERLTVLFGRSGLGKSSLLNAGLFPRLREDLHLPVYLRIGYGAGVAPRQQVWDALAAACTAASVQASAPRPDESLWAYFHRAGAGFWNPRRRPLLPVLVFDQFEEVFTVGQSDAASRTAAAAFLAELADLVEDRPSEALSRQLEADPARAETIDFERRGCRVVLSFREDFLAEMEGLRKGMPSLMRNRYRLLPMNGDQARAVIASGGELVAPDVAERIVGLAWRNQAIAPSADDAERIEVDPALLSVICSELNLRRRAKGLARIEPALLEGAEIEILADFYERSLRGLDPRLREFVEDELITAGGYRDSFAFDDALARPGITREALQQLVAGRLLRVDERFGVRRLELTHDVLTRVVKDSRDARRAREAEAAAQAREREASALLRRNRLRALASIVGLLLTLALFVWAYDTRREAKAFAALAHVEAEKARDEAQRARDEAEALREDSRKLGVIARDNAASAAEAQLRATLALSEAADAASAAQAQTERAASLQRNAQATDLIVAARSTLPEQQQLQMLLGAEALRRYPERLDAQVEQLARLLAAHRIRRLVDLEARILASAPVDAGRQVLLATATGRLVLLDAIGGRELGRWKLEANDLGEVRLQPSADGRIALVEADRAPLLVRLVPGQPLAALPIEIDGRGSSLAFAANGRWFADAGNPRSITITALDDAAATGTPRRIALPQLGAQRCLSFEAHPGQLTIGAEQETVLIDLRDASISRIPLPARSTGHSPDCTKALFVEKADDGGVRYTTRDLRDPAAALVLREQPATQPRPIVGEPFFIAGGAFVAARFTDGSELWPLATRRIIDRSLQELPNLSRETAMSSADGRWLALRRSGRGIELQRLHLGETESSARFSLPEPPAALHFAPDGRTALAVGDGHLVQVLQLGNSQPLHSAGQPFAAQQIEFSADGSFIGASSRDYSGLRLWDAGKGQPLPVPEGLSTIEFSPGGALAAGYGRGRARVDVFELRDGLQPLAPIDLTGESSISTLNFDLRARRIAIAVKGAVLIRDLKDPKWRMRIPTDAAVAVSKLAFHPREPVLAAVGNDGAIRTFGVLDGKPRWGVPAVPERYGENATAVAYSPDGRWLVVGRRDGTLVLRDPADGTARLALKPPRDVAAITNLVFVEGTSIVSAGGLDGGKDFWDLSARRWIGLVGPAPGRAGRSSADDLQAVAISSRGRRGALRHADDTVSLRDWDGPALVREACAVAGRNLSCDEWRRYLRDDPYRKTCEALPEHAQACRAGASR